MKKKLFEVFSVTAKTKDKRHDGFKNKILNSEGYL